MKTNLKNNIKNIRYLLSKKILIIGIATLFTITMLSGCIDDNSNQTQNNNHINSNIFTCKDIKNASYSSELKPTQWFTIGWGVLPASEGAFFQYGQYMNNKWMDHTFENKNLKSVMIVPPDNLIVENEWPGGILSIEYDNNETLDIYIPNFTDIPGDGFIDENGKTFYDGFFVDKDGSTYYDKELTDLARSKI